jgi:energy-converting hydrogenase Eha subunit C
VDEDMPPRFGTSTAMKRSGAAPASFVRPALLEGILLVTGASVAILSILAGDRINSTALVEFGMLSAIAATSAGVLFARYAVEVCGIIAGCRAFEHWSMRLNAAGYIVLGLYAAANALLDLTVPRRDADQFSFFGWAAASVATLVTLIVLQSKFRVLEQLPSRSLFESLSDDGVYLGLGVITLAALGAHIYASAWWLDTALDGVFVALVAVKMQAIRQRSPLLE